MKQLFIFPLLLFCFSGGAQTKRYQLTTTERHNGQLQPITIALCEMTSGLDAAGVPYEVIKWVNFRTIKGTDTIDNHELALTVKPYRISLHPKGKLTLPEIDVPGMAQSISDLHMFCFTIGPYMGLSMLKKPGDRFYLPMQVAADLANGSSIIAGRRCLTANNSLTAISNGILHVKSELRPPKVPCLRFLLNDMNSPVVRDTVNNLQMVRPAAAGRVNVLWGREYFNINNSIDQSTGILLKSVMLNDLRLKIKTACDAAYQHCQREVPLWIERKLTLLLLP